MYGFISQYVQYTIHAASILCQINFAVQPNFLPAFTVKTVANTVVNSERHCPLYSSDVHYLPQYSLLIFYCVLYITPKIANTKHTLFPYYSAIATSVKCKLACTCKLNIIDKAYKV